MRILYIHQYYKTPEEGGAIRSYYIANALVARGHEVELITSHNQKEYVQKSFDKLYVHYIPVTYNNHFGFLRRLRAFLTFAYKAYHLGAKLKDIDMAYITSTPLTVGLAALKLKKKNRIPYVFEVRDLWPEAPIQMGIIRGRILKFYLRKFEMNIYRNSDKMVALSPGILDHIARLVPLKAIHFCPNLSDCDFFHMSEKKNERLLKKLRINTEFIIGYFGAVGKVNALENFLNLAGISLTASLNIRFLLIGAGSELESIKEKSRNMGLSNIDFLPFMNKYELRDMLSVMDAAYISFGSYPVLEMNSPNKFFDAIASGKLVITNTRGWIKDLIEKNECGFYSDPSDTARFPTQIHSYINDSKLTKYQQNARYLAESSFEKHKLLNKLIDFLETKSSGSSV